ncbi:RIP metalloprotease RseP [Psychrobacillus lasiicapitis]|uniref:Zinc metalloprotease n=1 Tax=Psychrobacillus lasiicapitis TaxID=1636719 RepID=A0A544TF37_9BACI|nr:RIP metalloprotease RseP [Psychrobacillus lasiicapitis]TQR16075.1 RIP metalloprotease RseP [Psychrobacillus lasiicapitis]GGA15916.1 zinc metalloprotease [Psychrobacillus lasiicapitis]
METAIAFIIIFGSIVFFHELGHFIFAKKAGIMVREFAIGMGPKIFAMTKGETLYTLRLLPIGGYVRMAGEDLDSVELQPGYRLGIRVNNDNEIDQIVLNQNKQFPDMLFLEVEKSDLMKEMFIEGYDEEERLVRYKVARNAVINENGKETFIAPYDRQFGSKTVGQRSMAIFAGPLFNFILAFFIFLLLGLFQGVPTYEPVITTVVADSPAAQAGMKDGDLVTAINGNPISTWDEFSEEVKVSPNENMNFTIDRNGKTLELSMTPNEVVVGKEKVGQIGVQYVSPVEKNPLKAIPYGAEQTYETTKRIFILLGTLISGNFSIDDLSGPVGIYKATEEVAQYGVFNLMYWAALLSINLGIMNLLPLPALDGGRLLFFLFEAIRGKPVDKQKEGMVHFVGIMLLMVLMVVVTWNDIQRFFF